ncbi:MAG: MAPEG family protein [Pseudomonadota bacterium]
MITSLYAGVLALIYFRLSIETIVARRSKKISLGLGNNQEIAAIVSAHGNFASYAVFLLFLLFLVEKSQRFPNWLIHGVALVFVTGRILHFMAFRSEKMNFKKRVLGMQMTLMPLIFLGILNIVAFFLPLIYGS